MRRSTLVKPVLSVCVPSVLVLLVALVFALAATPTPAAAQARAQRLIFGSAGFTESNRFWTIARPEHLQYDPFLETLLDVDPKTGEFTPRLAEKWEASPDLKEWTFYLRKGVQFHYGFGEFTARDVVHSHSFMLRPDATADTAPLWREAEEVKVVNDYQVVFRLKRPMSIIPYIASRAGELRIVSKAQWDKEGLEGFEKRPAGTGSYRYVGRKTGISVEYERVDNHWGGRETRFQGTGDPPGARGDDALCHADEWRGPHRRPAPGAAEGCPEQGHEDFLVLAAGGLDVGLFWWPVLHAGRPQVPGERAVDQQKGAAGAEHGGEPPGDPGDDFRRQGHAGLCEWLAAHLRGLEPGVGEAVRPDSMATTRPEPKRS